MIQLEWANRIRKRLREDAYGMPWEEKDNVMAFIYPILNFAREQEERIDNEFKEHAKYFSKTHCTCGMTDLEPCDYCQGKKVDDDVAEMEYELNKSKEMN